MSCFYCKRLLCTKSGPKRRRKRVCLNHVHTIWFYLTRFVLAFSKTFFQDFSCKPYCLHKRQMLSLRFEFFFIIPKLPQNCFKAENTRSLMFWTHNHVWRISILIGWHISQRLISAYKNAIFLFTLFDLSYKTNFRLIG